jgi:hypothetical protein
MRIHWLAVLVLTFSFVTPLIGDEKQQTHEQWLLDRIQEAASIKEGMSRTDLLKTFDQEAGFQPVPGNRYVLKNCLYIKVNVEFVVPSNYSSSTPDKDLKIKKISDPYLGYAVMD